MKKNSLSLVLTLLVLLGFVSIGLPDGLAGVAWPSMRSYFRLPIDALGGLLLSYTAGYLISSFASGRLLARLGVGVLLGLSCVATGVSLLGYATASHWWVVLLFGAVAGLGAGAIDAGLNTYAATHFTSRMVNWLHAFYGIGALSGPLLMSKILDHGFGWQPGYAIVGSAQLILGGCFALTVRMWDDESGAAPAIVATKAGSPVFDTLRMPIVWLGNAVFFVYTGLEAAAGVWAFSLLTGSRGISMMTAGVWVSIYWGALTIGRILAAIFAGRVLARVLVRFCIAAQAVGALVLWLDPFKGASLLGLALIGLASGPIFPSLIASTPGRVHPSHLGNAVGFQIAAAVLGQSLIPALVGVAVRRLGLEIVGPALCGAALLLYLLHEIMTLTVIRELRPASTSRRMT